MAGDQRARRGHADEDGAGPVADRRRGLLAERRVGLVADDDRVGVRDLARVADEPLVGLDGDRPVRVVVAGQQRGRDALRVAAVAQLAVELVDEVAAVGEDQDAAGARGLDEAERGDRLAGAGGVLEPEALGGVGVLDRLAGLPLVVLGLGVGPVQRLLVGLVLDELLGQVLLARDRRGGEHQRLVGRGAVGAAVAVAVGAALGFGQQRGQRARERVDLVGGEHRAVDERRLVLGEQAVEPEQQRPAAAPLARRRRVALAELLQDPVERDAARHARRQRDGRVLAFEQERFARERFGARRGRRKKEGVRPPGSLYQAQP